MVACVPGIHVIDSLAMTKVEGSYWLTIKQFDAARTDVLFGQAVLHWHNKGQDQHLHKIVGCS